MNTERDGSNLRKVEFDIDQAEIFLHLMAEIDELIENHATSDGGSGSVQPPFQGLSPAEGATANKLNQFRRKVYLVYQTAKSYTGLIWTRFSKLSK